MKYVTETVSFQVIVYNICKASAWRRKEITRDLSPIQLLEKRVSLISFYVVAQKNVEAVRAKPVSQFPSSVRF